MRKVLSGGSNGGESDGNSIDLSVTTAIAEDIAKGKTAYTADGLVEGTNERWIKKMFDNGFSLNFTSVFIGVPIPGTIEGENRGYIYPPDNDWWLKYEDTENAIRLDNLFKECKALTTGVTTNTPLFVFEYLRQSNIV